MKEMISSARPVTLIDVFRETVSTSHFFQPKFTERFLESGIVRRAMDVAIKKTDIFHFLM